MSTAIDTKDQKGTITIAVTVNGGTCDAPATVAHRNDRVTWMIDGDLGPDDEVTIGPFGAGSPMIGQDAGRKRKGAGGVDDVVRSDAQPAIYHYEITVNRASGAASIFDPEIQIKP